MDKEMNAALTDIAIKLGGLEYLLLNLYGPQFNKAPDPVWAVQRYAEDLRQRMEKAGETIGGEPLIAFEEYIGAFFQRLARMVETERAQRPPK